MHADTYLLGQRQVYPLKGFVLRICIFEIRNCNLHTKAKSEEAVEFMVTVKWEVISESNFCEHLNVKKSVANECALRQSIFLSRNNSIANCTI